MIDEGLIEIIGELVLSVLLFVDAEIPESTGDAADTDDATNDDTDGGTSSFGGFVSKSPGLFAFMIPDSVDIILPSIEIIKALSLIFSSSSFFSSSSSSMRNIACSKSSKRMSFSSSVISNEFIESFKVGFSTGGSKVGSGKSMYENSVLSGWASRGMSNNLAI